MSSLAAEFDAAARLYEAGDHRAALESAERVVRADPKNAEGRYLLSRIQLHLGQVDRAQENLIAAIRLRPGDLRFHHNLGLVYRRLGRHDDAAASFDRALAIDPNERICIAAKADLFVLRDQPAAAYEILRPIVDAGDANPSIALVFGLVCRSAKRLPDGIALLERAIRTPGLMSHSKRGLLYQLAQLYDAAGEYDKAFETCAVANTMPRGREYDPYAMRSAIDRTIAAWTPEALAALPRSTISGEGLVFIVGMPRSGTSLAEQILASHPEVYGAGELGTITRLAFEVQPYQTAPMPIVDDVTALRKRQVLDRCARRFLDRLRGVPASKRVRVDKNPTDFMHLGLISLMFPKARVVHTVRDARDTGVSCYFTDFAGLLPFAYDLKHVGMFHRDSERLMEHWKRVLSIPIHTLEYQRVVDDQEATTRALLEFVGLPWNDACMRFHETQRVTMTASNQQVKQPLFRSSLERWKRYEKHLGPLMEGLGE